MTWKWISFWLGKCERTAHLNLELSNNAIYKNSLKRLKLVEKWL